MKRSKLPTSSPSDNGNRPSRSEEDIALSAHNTEGTFCSPDTSFLSIVEVIAEATADGFAMVFTARLGGEGCAPEVNIGLLELPELPIGTLPTFLEKLQEVADFGLEKAAIDEAFGIPVPTGWTRVARRGWQRPDLG